MKLGFIGLGRMGSLMARHLVEARHELVAYDIRPEAAELLATERPGVKVASSAAEAGRDCDFIFASLPGPAEVEAVVLGAPALVDAMRPGAVFIDLSTNSPSVVRRLAARLAERGITMLDAPVSGGIDGAAAGTLSTMVGGDPDAFERARPLLGAFASKVFYCGEAGSGSVVKLCNNICGAAYSVILGEALTLGVKAGVDLETLASVIGASTGASVRLTNRFPRYLFSRNFTPGFSVALSAKDTGLALSLADELGLPMQMAAIAKRELQTLIDRGEADLDFDAVVQLQEERAGVVLALGSHDAAGQEG